MTAAHILWQTKIARGNAVALTFEGKTWTFDELWTASSGPAAELQKRGLGRGDRIGILAGNAPEWLFWNVAVSRVGAIYVPINPAYTVAEIRNVLAAAELSLLVFDQSIPVAAEVVAQQKNTLDLDEAISLPAGSDDWVPPYDVDSDEPAVIFFSSGSTGQPKGIVHSSRNILRITEHVGAACNYGPDDEVLLSMPLAFVYASVVGWASGTRRGARMLLQRRFDAAAIIEALRVGSLSVALGVPNMYRSMLSEVGNSVDLGRSRLRLCLTAGDVLPRDLDEDFYQRFGTPLLDVYGLTETPCTVMHVAGVDKRTRPFSCGKVMKGIDVRIVDEEQNDTRPGLVGELVCRTPFTFQGYYRNDQATSEVLRDGWFWTGDLVRQDSDGYIYIVDRKKELIKRSGFNILPSEVESVIQSCRGVFEVGVVGVPDPQVGERVVAFIVADQGAAVSTDDIDAECRRQLAKYKIPQIYAVVPSLPRGATGKINRKMLREMGKQHHA